MQGLVQSYPSGTEKVFQWTQDEVVGKLNISRIFTKDDARDIVPGLLKLSFCLFGRKLNHKLSRFQGLSLSNG